MIYYNFHTFITSYIYYNIFFYKNQKREPLLALFRYSYYGFRYEAGAVEPLQLKNDCREAASNLHILRHEDALHQWADEHIELGLYFSHHLGEIGKEFSFHPFSLPNTFLPAQFPCGCALLPQPTWYVHYLHKAKELV